MAILDKLTRSTNSKTYLPEVDGFRTFAIIIVLLMHLNKGFGREIGYYVFEGQNIFGTFSYFINRGGLGVQIFFAISGFVVAIPFLKYYLQQSNCVFLRPPAKKPKMKSYFLNRLKRLQLPFTVAISFFFIVHIFLKEIPMNELWSHYLTTISYTHGLVYGTWSPLDPVTWSLETEIQFYILAPIILRALFHNNRDSTLSILLLSILFSFYGYHFIREFEILHLNSSILQQLQFFLVGVLVAYVYVMEPDFLKKRSYWWDLIGIGSICMVFYFFWGYFVADMGFILFLFLLFLSVFKGRLLNRLFSNKIIYTIGGMSYSIYLLHYPFFLFAFQVTKYLAVFDSYILNYWIQVVVIFPLLLLVCALFYYFVERPCMDKNWPKKLVAYLASKLQIKRA